MPTKFTIMIYKLHMDNIVFSPPFLQRKSSDPSPFLLRVQSLKAPKPTVWACIFAIRALGRSFFAGHFGQRTTYTVLHDMPETHSLDSKVRCFEDLW